MTKSVRSAVAALLVCGALSLFPTGALSSSDLPTECMRFEGTWPGKWHGARATTITVTNIRKRNGACIADVRYAWGALGSSTLVREEGSLDVADSIIEDGVLTVPIRPYDAEATFTHKSDDILKGTWSKVGYGNPLSGTFTKQNQ